MSVKCVPNVGTKCVGLPDIKLYQAMQWLALPIQQLEAKISAARVNNLALELDSDETCDEMDGASEEVFDSSKDEICLGGPDDSPWDDGFRGQVNRTKADRAFDSVETSDWLENQSAHGTPLEMHLHDQLCLDGVNADQMRCAEVIIANLNERGYLSVSVSEVASLVGVEGSVAEQALHIVQQLDPVGIAARDLRECLYLQAVALEIEEREEAAVEPTEPVGKSLVCRILDSCIIELGRQDLPAISRKLKANLSDVEAAVDRISRFDPSPATTVCGDEPKYVEPDAYVIRKGPGVYEVRVNHQAVPPVRVNRELLEQLKDKDFKKAIKGDEGASKWKLAVRNMTSEAVWIVSMLEQRKRVVQEVVKVILAEQMEYFEGGDLKRIRYQDIAELAEMSESTAHRACSNKFILTHLGLLPLNMFVDSGVDTDDGEQIARQSVKCHMRQLIDAEDKYKPLSDQKLVNALEQKGIHISRRGLQKYREAMGFGSSQERRFR